jgi:hypothetical protein
MAFYSNSVQPAAPGTSNDVMTLTGASGRKAQIHEICVTGLGTSSTANELGVYRPGAVGVTPTNQTSQKIDPDSGSASATVATAWVTQPSLGSVAMLRLGCNSNGGIYRWVAKPGQEIVARGDSLSSHSQVSLRFTTGGAGPMGVHMVFEEF